jgi:two-component sensor histidine kinase
MYRKDNHLKLDLENVFLGMNTIILPGIIINELEASFLKLIFPC